jgi:hypothetical protein
MVFVSVCLSGCGGSNGGGGGGGITYVTLGGTVSGLSGENLVLMNNDGSTQPVAANGPFTFSTPVPKGTTYSITIFTNPTSPWQTCVIANGSGLATANVTNVQVSCTINSYTVGGIVQGLAGSGLVLQINGGDNLSITQNGSFMFSAPLLSGTQYQIVVLTQPSSLSQTCGGPDAQGFITSGNVTSIQITCTTNSYFLGGAVNGLAGSGLVLQDNGGNNLGPFTKEGGAFEFVFPNPILSGSSFDVTVLTQPINPPQFCGVVNGGGTITNAAVSNVQVDCSAATTTYTIGGMVTNLVGTDLGLIDNNDDSFNVNVNGPFTFPAALASGAAYNVQAGSPVNPLQTCVVTNGSGIATANVTNIVVDCGVGDWKWVFGSNLIGQKGTTGQEGMPASGNVPGARFGGARWTDKSGNFWLFGGNGFAEGAQGLLNDLWEFTGGEWEWVAGSNGPNANGSYGMMNMAGAGNCPGGRSNSATWVDASGNLWLFGGTGYDSAGTLGPLNDLWEFTGGGWIWIGGSNLADQKGTFGNEGQAALGNIPSARGSASFWTDTNHNFWLYGGSGLDSTGATGSLSDLWEFSAGEWKWVSGAEVVNQAANFGALRLPASTNHPGARFNSTSWVDTSGNFWLFGGSAYYTTGTSGILNDLWEYSGGIWTWQNGSNTPNQKGVYGLFSAPGPNSPLDVPGSRQGGTSWTDTAGNLWLFGGIGLDSNGASGELSDLWIFWQGEWVWMAGPNVVNTKGTYGNLGTVGAANTPGARDSSIGWSDAAGNFWLFGVEGYDSAGATVRVLNDMWIFEPYLGPGGYPIAAREPKNILNPIQLAENFCGSFGRTTGKTFAIQSKCESGAANYGRKVAARK